MSEATPSRDVTLSICIPTHNFGDFLGATLATIVPQIVPGVEIDILDGGSTDRTPEVVAEWQRRCPAIRYHRQEQKGGIDRDMARVVELSRGRYFWLFSADDIMFEGAVSRVLAELPSAADIYLLGHAEVEFDLSLRRERHPTLTLQTDSTFDLRDPAEWRRYFEAANTTAAFFSYLGNLVVRRETWTSVPFDEAFAGSCYAHAVRLLTAMKRGLTLRYVAAPLSAWRAENDSFLNAGRVQRSSISIEGYHAIAAALFGDASWEARRIRRVLGNEYTLKYLLLTKHEVATQPNEDAARFDALVAINYRDFTVRNLIHRSFYRLFPAWLWPRVFAVWTWVRPAMKPMLRRLSS
jgi:abequosyltransferase